MSISHPAGNAAEAELTTTLMPNIPEPKRHFCRFWYVPNYLCTQYPVFPSSLTPTLYSKQMIPPRGPGSRSSICHIQTTTDQVTTEKKIQLEIKNGKSATFVSTSQSPSHLPFPRCKSWWRPWPSLTRRLSQQSTETLLKSLHCGHIPTPVPRPWGSPTMALNWQCN